MPMFPSTFLLFCLLSTVPYTTPVTIHLHKRRVISLFPQLHFGPGEVLQTCTNVPPGSCCRIVGPRRTPHSCPYRRLYAATFSGLEPLDVAAVWALSKAPGQIENGHIVNGGCTGRIAATHRGSDEGGTWTFQADMLFAARDWGHEVVELLGSELGFMIDRMEGASYVRLSLCQGSNFSSTEGLRAFLGGGGQNYAPTDGGSGATAAHRVDHQGDLNDPNGVYAKCALQRRDFEKNDSTWLWPDHITVGKITYTRSGDEQSLEYENAVMGNLDLEVL